MTEEQARARFMVLNAMRAVAVAIVIAGVANLGGRLLPELAPGLGYALIAFGAFDFFATPAFLKRTWRD